MPGPVMWIALVLSAAASVSATSEVAKRHPLVISQPFLAGSTDPTAGSTAWALTSHGISEKLFTVDKDGIIVPQVAQSVKKLSKYSWEVSLKSDYKFSDGTPVTAQHVADALTTLNQNSNGAQASLGIMTVVALDDLTLKIDSEQATPVMDAVLAEWPFVVFLAKDGQNYFTGPYMVETFVEDQRIELVPNPHYPRAIERPLLVIKKISDGDAAAAALVAGDSDMAFKLPVQKLSALSQEPGIDTKSFNVGYHYMMWYNTRNTQLSDVNVRKALDLALDRAALTQATLGGQATRSFFPKGTPYYLEEQELHDDASGAASLLDQAGWLKNAGGIREKDGVPLTLKLVAYPQQPGLVTIQPVIQQTFAALGIDMTTVVTSGDNWDELDAITADKNFDLLLWAQNTLPAGDPQWFINAFFRSDAGNNFAGLNSSEIDGLIDALSHADAATRVSASAAAHRAILQQVPVSMVMTPAWHVGLGSRLSDYVPWGSDYYIIHDGFGLPDTPPTTTTTQEELESTLSHGARMVNFSQLSIACILLLASLF